MSKKFFEWAVVGGGPAGIAAVGQLLDHGILPHTILWVDPAFKVGDFGQLWSNVPSNTTVNRFTDFLEAVSSFSYRQTSIDFQLNHLNSNETCILRHMVEPLQWISDKLAQRVVSLRTTVQKITLSRQLWTLYCHSQTFEARQVILATGSVPAKKSDANIEEIPLQIAMDKTQLAQVIKPNDCYAVFGSSHSAIIVIRWLVHLGVKKIINFYRSPCRYAIDLGSWILFDNTGLKGETARWAKENINGVLPTNLFRYTANQANIERFLPACTKAIYAIGFEKRNDLLITDYENVTYNPSVGIIGPGLFGLGIAYPEIKADPFGNVESQVGLWKFMVYLKKVMPIWLQYTP